MNQVGRHEKAVRIMLMEMAIALKGRLAPTSRLLSIGDIAKPGMVCGPQYR